MRCGDLCGQNWDAKPAFPKRSTYLWVRDSLRKRRGFRSQWGGARSCWKKRNKPVLQHSKISYSKKRIIVKKKAHSCSRVTWGFCIPHIRKECFLTMPLNENVASSLNHLPCFGANGYCTFTILFAWSLYQLKICTNPLLNTTHKFPSRSLWSKLIPMRSTFSFDASDRPGLLFLQRVGEYTSDSIPNSTISSFKCNLKI